MVSTTVGWLLVLSLRVSLGFQLHRSRCVHVSKHKNVPSTSRTFVTAAPQRRLVLLQQAQEGKDDDKEEAVLSDVDARVLRSMLQDKDKLDLQTEENMKKLLERGIQTKAPPTPPPSTSNESEFSSSLFKKLAETKLVQALQRNAADWVESASIFVSNRIERDSKLLAMVGIFAWERVVQDVARALPATSSRSNQQNLFLLANQSSYDNSTATLFDQLNTPLDELEQVTTAIRDILAGDTSVLQAGGRRRGLRTAAPAGQNMNAERQRRAYQRRKQTTLQQERQVLPDLPKMAGNILDTAWELKGELQSEAYIPGKRSEPLRNALQQGTTQLLQAVQEQQARLLQQQQAQAEPVVPQLMEQAALDTPSDPAVAESPTPTTIAEPLDPQTTVTFTTNDTELPGNDNAQQQQQQVTWNEEEEATELEFDQSLHEDLLTERQVLYERLCACIETPEDSWLRPELLREGAQIYIHEDTLQQVVETLMRVRNTLQEDTSNWIVLRDSLQLARNVIQELQPIATDAVSPAAARALKNYLVEETVLARLDEKYSNAAIAQDQQRHPYVARTVISQQPVESVVAEEPVEEPQTVIETVIQETTRESETPEPAFDVPPQTIPEPVVQVVEESHATATPVEPEVQEPSVTTEPFIQQTKEAEDARTVLKAEDVGDDAYVVDVSVANEAVVAETVLNPTIAPEIVEVEVMDVKPKTVSVETSFVDATSSTAQVVFDSDESATVEVLPDDGMRRVTAEVVSDDDFEGVSDAAKRVDAEEEEVDGAVKKKGLGDLGLKVLDSMVFVVERTLTVGIPKAITLTSTASKRMEDIGRSGMGYEGWDVIENAKDGAKRY